MLFTYAGNPEPRVRDLRQCLQDEVVSLSLNKVSHRGNGELAAYSKVGPGGLTIFQPEQVQIDTISQDSMDSGDLTSGR